MAKSKVHSFDKNLLKWIKHEKCFEKVKLAIERKKLVNAIDGSENSLLHYAATYGNIKVAQYLLDSDSDVNAQNSRKDTPLMIATRNCKCSHQVGLLLLHKGADTSLKNTANECAVDLVLGYDKTTISKEITSYFRRLLQIVYMNDPKKIAKKLLQARWSLSKIIQLDDAEVTNSVLSRRLFPNLRINRFVTGTNPRETLLHIAVKHIAAQNVKLLLERGAKPNILNKAGSTPLSYVYNENKDDQRHDDNATIMVEHNEDRVVILKQLLEKTREKDRDIHDISAVLKFGNAEAVQLLIDSNISPFCTEESMKLKAMFLLAKNRNVGSFEVLRNKNLNVNLRNEYGETLLMVAASSSNHEVVKFLLDEGANIDDVKDEHTALFYTLDYTDIDEEQAKQCVLLLLERGAKIQTENTTILDVVCQFEMWSIAKTILSYLILEEKRGTVMTDVVRRQIHSDKNLKKIFDSYEQDLLTVAYNQTTLLQFLQSNNNILAQIVRNKLSLAEIEGVASNLSNNPYFHCTILKCIAKGEEIIELQNAAAPILSQMIQINYDSYQHILIRILDKLEESDLKNLINLNI